MAGGFHVRQHRQNTSIIWKVLLDEYWLKGSGEDSQMCWQASYWFFTQEGEVTGAPETASESCGSLWRHPGQKARLMS